MYPSQEQQKGGSDAHWFPPAQFGHCWQKVVVTNQVTHSVECECVIEGAKTYEAHPRLVRDDPHSSPELRRIGAPGTEETAGYRYQGSGYC